MRNIDPLALFAVLVGIFLVCLGAFGYNEYGVQKRCLAAGFPDYRLAMFTGYCVKRVDQTDLVVPVASLER